MQVFRCKKEAEFQRRKSLNKSFNKSFNEGRNEASLNAARALLALGVNTKEQIAIRAQLPPEEITRMAEELARA